MTEGWFHAPTDPHVNPNDPKGTCYSARDWLGNRFHVGETVLYCIGAGRGQMMALGEVLQISAKAKVARDGVWVTENDDYDRSWDHQGVMRYIKYVEKPYIEVTVQVRTHKTSGAWDNKSRTRPAWVNPMNITAIPKDFSCVLS